MASFEELWLKILLSKSSCDLHDRRSRPAWNKLRIDGFDGSPAVEYRIQNGHVARRTVDSAAECQAAEDQWERLTPEDFSYHVRAGTVVAFWLYHRMGPDAVSRACVSHREPDSNVTPARRRYRQQMPGMFGPLQPVAE